MAFVEVLRRIEKNYGEQLFLGCTKNTVEI